MESENKNKGRNIFLEVFLTKHFPQTFSFRSRPGPWPWRWRRAYWWKIHWPYAWLGFYFPGSIHVAKIMYDNKNNRSHYNSPIFHFFYICYSTLTAALALWGLFFPTCKLTCTFTCNVSRILHNDCKNLKSCTICLLMIHKVSVFYAHYNKFYIVLQVRFLDFHSEKIEKSKHNFL